MASAMTGLAAAIMLAGLSTSNSAVAIAFGGLSVADYSARERANTDGHITMLGSVNGRGGGMAAGSRGGCTGRVIWSSGITAGGTFAGERAHHVSKWRRHDASKLEGYRCD